MELQTTAIVYRGHMSVEIGDVFYSVESGQSEYFTEKCKMCGDTHKITINGITEDCPHCRKDTNRVTIRHYIVKRYRVFGIEQRINTYDWKYDGGIPKITEIQLYNKVGHGYTNTEIRRERVEDFLNRLNRGGEKPWFDDYKLAVACADGMNYDEERKLRKFNEEFGTSHTCHWTVENDRKSK